MDDCILIHKSKEYLQQCLINMREYVVKELGIEFNEKTQIIPMAEGVDYLGFHFYLTDTGKVIRRLRTSAKKRYKKRLKYIKRQYELGKMQIKEITPVVASYHAHLSHGHTYNLRKKEMDKFVLHHGED